MQRKGDRNILRWLILSLVSLGLAGMQRSRDTLQDPERHLSIRGWGSLTRLPSSPSGHIPEPRSLPAELFLTLQAVLLEKMKDNPWFLHMAALVPWKHTLSDPAKSRNTGDKAISSFSHQHQSSRPTHCSPVGISGVSETHQPRVFPNAENTNPALWMVSLLFLSLPWTNWEAPCNSFH